MALDPGGGRPDTGTARPSVVRFDPVHAVDFRRAAGLAALAAPFLMWFEFLAMGTSRYGYDLLTRPFSDLATRGTPNAGLFDLGFFLVPGILTVVLGLGLYRVNHGQAWRVGALMVTGSVVEGLLHGTMAQTCFALASVAPLLLFLGSADQRHLAPPRRIWLGAAVAAFAIEALAVAARPLTHYPDGLFQRPFTLVLTIWFITTGAWLLRGRKFEGLSVPD